MRQLLLSLLLLLFLLLTWPYIQYKANHISHRSASLLINHTRIYIYICHYQIINQSHINHIFQPYLNISTVYYIVSHIHQPYMNPTTIPPLPRHAFMASHLHHPRRDWRSRGRPPGGRQAPVLARAAAEAQRHGSAEVEMGQFGAEEWPMMMDDEDGWG